MFQFTVILIFSKLEINIEMIVGICILNDSLEALSCGYLNQLRFLRWRRVNGVGSRQRCRGAANDEVFIRDCVAPRHSKAAFHERLQSFYSR